MSMKVFESNPKFLALLILFSLFLLSSCGEDDEKIHTEIISLTPEVGETVSSSLRFIQITFNADTEDALNLSRSPFVLKDSRGKKIQTITNMSGTLMVITILDDLAPGLKYTLVANELVENLSSLERLKGYHFFTSDEVETSPLELVTSYPQNNQSHVATESLLSLEFNNPLVLEGDFNISLVNKLSSQEEMIKVEVVENQLYITPLETLASSTEYHLYLDRGIRDIYGSSFSGESIRFETGAPQLLLGSSFDTDVEAQEVVVAPVRLVQSKETGMSARVFTKKALIDQSESVWAQIGDGPAVRLWHGFSGEVTNIETLVTANGKIAVAMAAKNEHTASLLLSVYSNGEWETQLTNFSGREITDLILVEGQQNVLYLIWRVLHGSGPELQVNLSYVRGQNGVVTSSPEVIASSPGLMSFQKLSHYWKPDTQDRQTLRLTHQSWDLGYVTRENRFNHFGEHTGMSTIFYGNSGIDFLKVYQGRDDYRVEILLPEGEPSRQEYILTAYKGDDEVLWGKSLRATRHNQFDNIQVAQTENGSFVILYVSANSNKVELKVVDKDGNIAGIASRALPSGGSPPSRLNLKSQGNDFFLSYSYMGRLVIARGNTQRNSFDFLQLRDARVLGLESPYLFIESAALETFINDNGQRDSYWNIAVKNTRILSPFSAGTIHSLILKNTTPQPVILDDFLFRGECDENLLNAEIRTWNGHDVLWINDNTHEGFKAEAPAGSNVDIQGCFMRFFITVPAGHRLDVQRPNLSNVGLAADVVFAGNNMGQGGQFLADLDWGFMSSAQMTSDQYSTMVTTPTTQGFYGGFFFDNPIQQFGCNQNAQQVVFDVNMNLTVQSSQTHETAFALRRLNFYMATSSCNAFGTAAGNTNPSL